MMKISREKHSMVLYFNVSRLLKSDIGDSRSHSFARDTALDLDEAEATGIEGQVKFTLTNFGIIASVQAKARLHLTCARCIEPFETAIEIGFDEEYQPVIDIASGLPSSAPRSDAASTISPNHIIDLDEAVRQDLLVAMELVPLCRPDCKGLCPECGANRNLEPCTCPPSEPPSPFVVLQTLFSGAETNDS
jgi:uncharacterized protein